NIFSLILLTTFYLSNVSAENYTRWDLPDGAIARIGKGEIDAIKYSPDGTQLAVATAIGIWIYDAKTYQEIDLLKAKGYSSYRGITFSPDGKTLASSKGGFGGILLWDIANRTIKQELDSPIYTGSRNVLFSPDGATLASHRIKDLFLWDVVTGKNRKLEKHTDAVGGIAFSPDGKILACGSKDQTINLWEVATGSVKHTLRHTDSVTSVSISPDGKTLASGSVDNTISFWDLETGTHVKTFKEAEVNVTQVSFSPNGQFILSWGMGESKVLLWDVNTGKYKQIDDLTRQRISVCFSPDGSTIAAAYEDHIIDFFDTVTGEHKKRIVGNNFQDLTLFMGSFADLTLSPDGTKLVSMNFDRSINLCDITSGQCRLLIRRSPSIGNLNRFLFSSDSNLLAGMYSDGFIGLWDANTGKEQHLSERIRFFEKNHKVLLGLHLYEREFGIAFSPDNQILASASSYNSIQLWDTTTGNIRHSLTGHTARVESLCFSSNGQTLVSGSFDGTLRLWNAATGELKKTFTNRLLAKQQTSKPIAVTTVALNPDGDRVASGSQDGTIVMWDVVTGERIGTFIGHVDAISDIFFSPDGRKIVSTSKDGSVRLWDIATGQQEYAIAGYKLTVWKVILYENGISLACDMKRGVPLRAKRYINLWDLDTGKRMEIQIGHTNGGVTSIDFSADGKTLISGSTAGTVLVWDILNIIREENK
ncbi:PQQ-binding-like beta-propeller repeat protein, partial [Candidatus Poribacteria bacterium]|nr:PQQ-binding-like beta-propeller repeat protein [Candidatus Poribacteria bacterium]